MAQLSTDAQILAGLPHSPDFVEVKGPAHLSQLLGIGRCELDHQDGGVCLANLTASGACPRPDGHA